MILRPWRTDTNGWRNTSICHEDRLFLTCALNLDHHARSADALVTTPKIVATLRSKLLPLPFQGKAKLARAIDNADSGIILEGELKVHPTSRRPRRPAPHPKHKVAKC